MLLLNSDIIFEPGCLSTLVRFLREHPDAAGVGPLYLNPDRTPQQHHFRLPTYATTACQHERAARGAAADQAQRALVPDARRRLLAAAAGASAVGQRAAAAPVVLPPDHMMDEQYPVYFNDVALARSLVLQGHELWMTPESVVLHEHGASTRLLGGKLRRQYLASLTRYLAASEPRHRRVALRSLLLVQAWPRRRWGGPSRCRRATSGAPFAAIPASCRRRPPSPARPPPGTSLSARCSGVGTARSLGTSSGPPCPPTQDDEDLMPVGSRKEAGDVVAIVGNVRAVVIAVAVGLFGRARGTLDGDGRPLRPAGANAIVCENSKPGRRGATGTSSAAATRRSRASRRTSASTRRDGPVQGRHGRDGLHDRHLPARLLQRRRRAQVGHRSRRRRRCRRSSPPASTRHQRPASSTAATGPCRRRGRCRPSAVSGVYIAQARPRPTPAAPATSSSSCATTTALRHRRPDVRHDVAGLQPATAATASTRRPPGGSRATRSATTGRSRPRRRSRELFFSAEYPMVRWLERNGYDVSYIDRRRHRPQRGRAARAQGLPLGRPRRVLVGRTARERRGGARRRREPRVLQRQRGVLEDALGAEHRRRRTRRTRTLVCYKETHGRREDRPAPDVDRDLARPALQPAADGGRPENALTGTLFTVNGIPRRSAQGARTPTAACGFWRNTSVANLAAGTDGDARRPASLGYEWDEDLDNGFRPAGLIHLSSTTSTSTQPTSRTTGTHVRARDRDAPR